MPQGDCAVKFVALLTNFSHGHYFGGGIDTGAILDREQTQINRNDDEGPAARARDLVSKGHNPS
jgi:hypothetical protein